MIVWVDDRLFADDTRDVDRLALLRNAALRRHTLIVSAAPDDRYASRRAPNFDAWLNALPERLRAEVNMLLERVCLVSANTAVRSTTRLLVCAQDPGASRDSCWLTLADAVRAIAQPLRLMVENQINDAAFIRRAMPPEWRLRLEK